MFWIAVLSFGPGLNLFVLLAAMCCFQAVLKSSGEVPGFSELMYIDHKVCCTLNYVFPKHITSLNILLISIITF